MSVIIGVDPHKLLHAACAIDERETELARLEVRTNSRQVSDLLAWAAPFECRSWAIESAGGLGYLLAQQLDARGEHVVDVPATLSSRVRLLGSGKSTKNDANDARAVAVAALRAPQLARMIDEVLASATTLTGVFGIGPILAAMIIGYTGDVTRFPSAGHYAAYNGTAPVEFSSSGRTVHRLSRRGNRTLNHALHMIAVTQIRHAHSEGRGYYDRKLAEGNTPREARRALKRQISDRRLPTAASRRREQVGPGGQSGNDSHIQRGRRNPGTRHFGRGHSRTQHQP
jgi:transposase